MRNFLLIAALCPVLAWAAVSPPVMTHSTASPKVAIDLRDSSSADADVLSGLTNASSGLSISCRANTQQTWTDYTAGAGTIETVTTIGTYQAPTSGRIRFREIETEGVYELHFDSDLFDEANANAVECKVFDSGTGLNLLTKVFSIYLGFVESGTAVAEPTSVPAANASLEEKISWMYAVMRNEMQQSTTQQCLRNDADTADIGCAATTDSGTVFTRGEFQ